jgi:NRPS condensation-like uncharacterized protein
MKKQFATSLDENIIRELKVYCAENDYAMNDIIENSIHLYLTIACNKTNAKIIDSLPGSRAGSRIEQLLSNQG